MTITSIPLVIAYLADRSPHFELIVHFHVIFGLLFIITAIPLMIMKRKQEKPRNYAN
ncbi:MAG: hypothetical protein U5K32_02745 [Bacteroidales bacterium]|nr:hypothetical protein [Bacteroidales bacterium]